MALSRTKLFWLLAYLAVMTALVVALVVARRRTMAALTTPEARQQWRAWKDQTVLQKNSGGPVERRPVVSDEPPALILLRDRFPTIVASSVLICSFLFAFLAFVAQGALRDRRRAP